MPLPPLRERREGHSRCSSSTSCCRPPPATSARCRRRRRPYPATGRLRLAGQRARAAQRGRPLRPRHRSRLAALRPAAADTARPLNETVEAFERALIADALRRHGSLGPHRRSLAVAKTTLHDKIRKYGLGEGSPAATARAAPARQADAYTGDSSPDIDMLSAEQFFGFLLAASVITVAPGRTT